MFEMNSEFVLVDEFDIQMASWMNRTFSELNNLENVV